MELRTRLFCRGEARAQPTNLAAVVNLVLGDMEPRPVRIHCGGSAERLLQPDIIAGGKARERDTAYLAELVGVVLERLATKETAPLGAKREGGLPRSFLLCRGRSLLESDTLIPTLHHSDVSQERANRVTAVILQMIKFRHAQSIDGGECGLARIEQNTHQPADNGRVTRQRFETE